MNQVSSSIHTFQTRKIRNARANRFSFCHNHTVQTVGCYSIFLRFIETKYQVPRTKSTSAQFLPEPS